MKILGDRILVSKLEEEKKDGFQTVDIQDSFVNKGKVEQIGECNSVVNGIPYLPAFAVGDTVLFNKYSPDTQEIEHEGKKYKVILASDIIAVL